MAKFHFLPSMSEDVVALVVDCGSGFTKAGFAGDDAPRSVFPSIVGCKRQQPGFCVGLSEKRFHYGEQALRHRSCLDLVRPIERLGLVSHWTEMETLLNHVYYHELRVAPEEHPVLFSEPPLNSKANRDQLTQLAFETHNSPAIYISLGPTLSLYASGRTTGLVMDAGDSMCCAVPFKDGQPLDNAVQRCPFGGRDIDAYLLKLLESRGYEFASPLERDSIRLVKEKMGYATMDFAGALDDARTTNCDQTFEWPDGQSIVAGTEWFACVEALFQPELVGLRPLCGQFHQPDALDASNGIHEAIYNAIQKCDTDLQAELSQQIVLAGGSSMFRGLGDRLQKELVSLSPQIRKIIVAPERKYQTWLGGSILASLATFQQMWKSKEEYDESGPTIHSRKCF